MKTWKKEWKTFHFEICWHVGRKEFMLEVLKVTPEPHVAKDYKSYTTLDTTFNKSFNELFSSLRNYGYGNSLRFILGD